MKNDDASKLKRSLAIMAAAIVKICNAPNQVDHPHIEFKKFLKYLPFRFVFAFRKCNHSVEQIYSTGGPRLVRFLGF